MIFYNRSFRSILILLTLFAMTFWIVFDITPVSAATIVVNTEDDNTIAGDGNCTLREAINNAISASDTTSSDCVAGTSGANTITLGEGTITLTSQLPSITSEIIINGDNAETTIIEASTCNPITTPDGCTPVDYRVFSLETGGDLTLDHLTIRHGNRDAGGAITSLGGTLNIANSTLSGNHANNAGGAIYIDSSSILEISTTIITGNGSSLDGGGIYNKGGTLTLSNNSMIDHNVCPRYGGGIYNIGAMTVIASTISDNEAHYGGGVLSGADSSMDILESTISGNWVDFLGGGIGASTDVSLFVSNSTISSNVSEGSGGGISIYTNSFLEVTNSTLSGNTSDVNGGGIYAYSISSLYIENSTLAENICEHYGGGVHSDNAESLHIKNSTLSGNSAMSGAGIFYDGVLNFTNTIIANSTSGWDCHNQGAIGTNINNLVEDGSCSDGGINFLSGDPLLGPLSDNGGLTQTQALLFGSPAIDAGDLAECPGTDQRGVSRPQGAGCDIGAYETTLLHGIFVPLISK